MLAGIPLCLSISGVEKMFRQMNLRDGNNAPAGLVGDLARRDTDPCPATQMSEPSNYPDSLGTDINEGGQR